MKDISDKIDGLYFEGKVPDDWNKEIIQFNHGGGLNYQSGLPIVDYFSEEGFATFTMSLRGHTGSYMPNEFQKTTLDDYVSDIETVANYLSLKYDTKPKRIHQIGHSLSALSVLKAQGLGNKILLAPILTKEVHDHFGGDLTKVYNFPIPVEAFLGYITENKSEIEQLTPTPHLDMFFGDGRDTSQYEGKLSVEPWNTRWESLVNDGGYSISRDGVNSRLLVIVGKRDPLIKVEGARELANLYGGKYHFVDSSHMIMYDNWGPTAPIILDFLQK